MIGHGFMEENGLTPYPKKDISSPQYRSSPRNLKFSQPLATRYKIFFSPTKKYLCVRGGYMPWKIRIQGHATRNLLGQGTKSEKW